jgi:hypothetical protein
LVNQRNRRLPSPSYIPNNLTCWMIVNSIQEVFAKESED